MLFGPDGHGILKYGHEVTIHLYVMIYVLSDPLNHKVRQGQHQSYCKMERVHLELRPCRIRGHEQTLMSPTDNAPHLAFTCSHVGDPICSIARGDKNMK